MSVSFSPGFLPRFSPQLPLHLMKSPEVKLTGQGGSQPKAGALRAGAGYMSSDGANVSTVGLWVTLRAQGCEPGDPVLTAVRCLQVLSGQKAEEIPEALCRPSKCPQPQRNSPGVQLSHGRFP